MKPNFIKFTNLYFTISLLLILPSLFMLITHGLKLSIDFTGGSLLEIAISPDEQISESDLNSSIEEIVQVTSIQSTGDSYLIRSKSLDPQTHQQLLDHLDNKFSTLEELRFETVGPTLGEELVQKTLLAVVFATIAILAYVAYQFKELKYGVCAILAMFHDTIIVLGVFSFLGYFLDIEIDTLTVTAVLTILSFSVHDTIVVYDRIRETLRRHSKAPYPSIVNKAITETLARSINNSMTIIFMLSSLFLLGGESIRWFIFALLIGTITGTYSSTFTAAPLLVLWDKLAAKRK